MTEPVKIARDRLAKPGTIGSMKVGQRAWIWEIPLLLDDRSRLWVWTEGRLLNWFDRLIVPGPFVHIRRVADGIVVEDWPGAWCAADWNLPVSAPRYLPVVGIPD